jgi:two-component system, OmpR family, response regulator ChvI
MKNVKRILIVEDESDIIFTLKIILEQNGFVINSFTDPLSALSSFKPNLYDILLIDIKLPSINGFELCREIRKVDDKVKICFLTASEINYEELKKAVFPSEKDAICLIRKPVENEALLMHLNKMLE